MSTPEYDDDLPVLNDVVESGNESIIQSSRLGREVLRELEVLKREPVEPFTIDADRSFDLLTDEPETDDDDVEQMIDNLVDRHITELRKDIAELLERVKKRP